jgi:HK97 family phage major capsid protein
MLSIQEILSQTVEQRKTLESFMDEKGYFDPSEASAFNGLKRSINREVYETIRKVSLAEFLSKANTSAGGQYLVPDAVSAKIYSSLQTTDLIPYISADVVTPRGDTMTVNVGSNLKAKISSNGAPTETVETTPAYIKLQKFKVAPQITNDLIEDNEYGLVEWHLQEGARALADAGNNLALETLFAAPDGVGTQATGSNFSLTYDMGSITSNFSPDTAVVPIAYFAVNSSLSGSLGNQILPPRNPQSKVYLAGLDVYVNNGVVFNPDAAAGTFYCVIFAKDYAMLTARKSWGRIENYSKPIEDLAGAVITGRQDNVTLNKDAICAVTASSGA